MKYIMIVLVIVALFLGCGGDTPEPTIEATETPETPAGGVIGQWSNGIVSDSSVLTLYKNSVGTWFQEEFGDNTTAPYYKPVEEVNTENSKTRRFDETDGSGRYYVIDSNDDLLLFNSTGQTRIVSPR